MRITNNYQSYYTKNATSTSGSSDSTTSILSNLKSASTLFSKASLSSETTANTSVSDILSEMTSAPNAQQMRLKMEHVDESTEAEREKMKTMMDTLASADLESMSLEEKQALMEEVKTTMDAIHGTDENAVAVSDLSEEDLTAMLSDMQSKALEGPRGPGGPPPGGPPPNGGGVEGVEASSSSSEEDALTTLEALLEALSAAEEEEAAEETSDEETEAENVVRINEQTFKSAIEQYFKNQNWDVANLNTLFEA